MKKVILAGNAISADIIYAYLRTDSRYHVVATVVDDDYLAESIITDIPACGLSQIGASHPPGEVVVIMAIGYNNLNKGRESMFLRLKAMGYGMESYVHPAANVYTEHPLGEGCVILPAAVLEPHVRVGANTLVWCNATLAHHATVAENCWIASGAVISGQASVARNSFVGVNATVVNKISVGESNIVGAGALITKDTKANSVHLARSAEELRYSAEDYVKYFGI